jgi:ribonuclease HI
MQSVYHVDGYCSRNGKRDAEGGITVFKDGNLFLSRPLEKRGVTNNECELEALGAAVEAAEEGDEIVLDSMTVFYWTRSGKPKARPDLRERCQELKEAIRRKKLDVYWASREENLAGYFNEAVFNL